MANPPWPFDPEAPVPFGPVPTASQFDLMREQIQAAADGRVWSDVAGWKNFILKIAQSVGGAAMIWEPTTKRFLSFGNTGGIPVQPSGIASRSGRIWTTLSIPLGAGLTPPQQWCADANSSGVVVLGGTPGSSSNEKYRRSPDGGATWAVANSSLTNTAGVNSVRWVQSLALWVAGHTDGNIETSPDGTTWTQRTAPNAFQRAQIAWGTPSGSPLVVMGCTSSGGSAQVLTSPDGLNWTNRVLGGTNPEARSVAWNARLALFLSGSNLSTQLSSSANGTSWSQAGLTFPGTSALSHLHAVGRVFIAVSTHDGVKTLFYSLDGGQSWAFLNQLDLSTFGTLAVAWDSSQLIAADGSANHYCSFATGF